MIGSLVFSVSIKVCKNLQFTIKTDFWPNKFLLENVQLSLSTRKKWILIGNPYASTSRVHHPHFSNIQKSIPHISSFSLIVGLWKMYMFLLLKLPMDSQWIQASSSKRISIPNVRKDFHIYLARRSATLAKMSKWCFVWQYEYGYLPLHIEI